MTYANEAKYLAESIAECELTHTQTERKKETTNKQTKKMLIIQTPRRPSQLTGPISKTIHVNSIHGNW